MSSTNITLNPYLTFNGKASEAMKFYHSILGGDLTMQTFGEANMAESPNERNLIVHAVLKNAGITIMASDGHAGDEVKIGENISLSIQGADQAKLSEVFRKLGEGGSVTMPLAKQFWGDTFGMLTDRYGMHWMVNIVSPQPNQ